MAGKDYNAEILKLQKRINAAVIENEKLAKLTNQLRERKKAKSEHKELIKTVKKDEPETALEISEQRVEELEAREFDLEEKLEEYQEKFKDQDKWLDGLTEYELLGGTLTYKADTLLLIELMVEFTEAMLTVPPQIMLESLRFKKLLY